MKELQRIRVLEDGLQAVRSYIHRKYPNGAPEEMRELFAIAAEAMRKSDEIALGRASTGDTDR